MKSQRATIYRRRAIFAAGLLFVSGSAAFSSRAADQIGAGSGNTKNMQVSPSTTSPLEAPSAPAAAQKGGEPPTSVIYVHKLPPCLSEIAAATSIEDANLRSARSRQSLLAAEKLDATASATLEEMVEKATPAGRLISLALLRKMKIDPKRYRELADKLNSEAGDQSVSYVAPGERCHYNVADILNDMASNQPLIKILP
jgi:hypothetical protein